jgi:hypothetical protein
MASFYELNPAQQQVARAQRAALAQTIIECDRAGFAIWLFCPWCGHSRLAETRWLVAQVKDPPNMLDELEKRLTCDKCRRRGVRLIPTDRTMASFDRMGASQRN